MRLSTALLAAAAWFGVASASPLTARQEALRFGVVSVAPNSVKPNDVRVSVASHFSLRNTETERTGTASVRRTTS